jgi:hypothetical protein
VGEDPIEALLADVVAQELAADSMLAGLAHQIWLARALYNRNAPPRAGRFWGYYREER